MTNCPNCGAPIDPWKQKCDYCGTTYFDFTIIKTDEPFYIRIQTDHGTLVSLVQMASMSINQEISRPTDVYYYDADFPLYPTLHQESDMTIDVNMVFHAIPDRSTGVSCKFEKNRKEDE